MCSGMSVHILYTKSTLRVILTRFFLVMCYFMFFFVIVLSVVIKNMFSVSFLNVYIS